jgi:hypothetical protein
VAFRSSCLGERRVWRGARHAASSRLEAIRIVSAAQVWIALSLEPVTGLAEGETRRLLAMTDKRWLLAVATRG